MLKANEGEAVMEKSKSTIVKFLIAIILLSFSNPAFAENLMRIITE